MIIEFSLEKVIYWMYAEQWKRKVRTWLFLHFTNYIMKVKNIFIESHTAFFFVFSEIFSCNLMGSTYGTNRPFLKRKLKS